MLQQLLEVVDGNEVEADVQNSFDFKLLSALYEDCNDGACLRSTIIHLSRLTATQNIKG